jgi:hypothetical protein
MLRVLFVTSSSYSGSTLLSFLLNTHPRIFTVGEMNGWNYGENETFKCSCGKVLSDCPFFRRISNAFRENDLHFDPRNFGTDYRLAESERLNRYLTGPLPGAIPSTVLEKTRDALVAYVPSFSRLLARQDRANRTFFHTALSYSGAYVFVDACKDPYRLRHLRRIQDIDLHVVYLVRDLRGVVFSNFELRKPGWDAKSATRMWIRQQLNILRIISDFPRTISVYYEDLCDAPDETLAAIHRFIGLDPYPFTGNLKSAEHHILGNVMRLSNVDKIVKNTRWERELSTGDLEAISRTAMDFVHRNKHHPLSKVIQHYLKE